MKIRYDRKMVKKVFKDETREIVEVIKKEINPNLENIDSIKIDKSDIELDPDSLEFIDWDSLPK
ncbi:MAG: hypothetical protein IH899_13295 [Planctomycetes bacterium]|nr:hypothetical protein [Planctomycetota bacterium]